MFYSWYLRTYPYDFFPTDLNSDATAKCDIARVIHSLTILEITQIYVTNAVAFNLEVIFGARSRMK